MQARHGDVMVQSIARLPEHRKKLPHLILARGEITGHSHRLRESDGAVLYETPTEWALEVTAEVVHLIHEEHATIQLPRGVYRVWRQREYSPTEIRTIRD